jgi:hypothetical protein
VVILAKESIFVNEKFIDPACGTLLTL